MHREIRKLLPRATGFSEFAIAVTIDIRDFSTFAGDQDATGVAEFIKRFYTKVIKTYFPRPRFFKPTGDGLLIIRSYTSPTLRRVAVDTVTSSLKLVQDFPSLFTGDAMLNFTLPDRLGVGLARGAVCGLESAGKIVDYSGKCLNLSSRMMDFARPQGVVFDAGFGPRLLPEGVMEGFDEASVCIKGIAPRKPMSIYYTKAYTTIPPRASEPVEQTEWHTHKDEKTLRTMKEIGSNFEYRLPTAPADPQKITVRVRHPRVVGSRKARDGTVSFFDFTRFTFSEFAGEPRVLVDFAELSAYLESVGVGPSWPVHISVIYPKR